MKAKKAKAKINIISSGKDKRVYCREGDELEIIGDHGDVLICEFKDQKFPVRKENLCLTQEN